MKSKTIIYVLVGAWIGCIIISIAASQAVDGPRNIDTGLKRLDILVKWQLVAFITAIISGLLALFIRSQSRLTRLVGATPITLTIILIGALYLWMTFANQQYDVQTSPNTTKPTATVDPET